MVRGGPVSRTFDLAIIGGGPAGTAAAITGARAGASVLLLDRDSFPRHKVCGEFVSAESLSLLGNLLGPEHPLLVATPTISAGRLFLSGSVTDVHINPPARSIPRYDLDLALWTAAEAAGVETHPAEAAAKLTGDGPFVIRSAQGSYDSRTVINASGRWSGMMKTLEPPHGPKWIGLKAHYETSRTDTTVDLYFFRHGYCGIQPVRTGVVNVCAMVRSDVATTMEAMLECHPTLKIRSLDLRPLTDPVVTAPLVHGPTDPVVGCVMQVGDAAGFIDPFLGDGISIALQTGTRAARRLLPFVAGVSSLRQAVESYVSDYHRNIQPAFAHAARLRRILSSSGPFQPAVTGLLKIPHLIEWSLKRTRAKMYASD